jgi:ribosomal protein L36
VRGMKVRSSVKKLCEGCKVRLAIVLGLCYFVFDCAGSYIMEDEQ